jgi:hypothetical protein
MLSCIYDATGHMDEYILKLQTAPLESFKEWNDIRGTGLGKQLK